MGDVTTGRDGRLGVFLLDDHEVVRRGMAAMIDAEPDLEVVGQSESAATALAEIERCAPDVAVLDVRLPDGNGIEVCREVRSNFPTVPCLIFTSFGNDQSLVDAAMAGAAGFVIKRLKGSEILDSIRRVGRGETLLDDATTRMALRRLSDSSIGGLVHLTDREQRIFELIGEGHTNRQIAEAMCLSEKTVKNYVSNMLAKLGMSSRTEAAALAARVDERRRAGT